MKLFQKLAATALSIVCTIAVAQTTTNTKIVDLTLSAGTFSVELKNCVKNSDPSNNVICNFIWTNKSVKDVVQGFYASNLFRAFDSAGTRIQISVLKVGNSSWTGGSNILFAAQLPTRVSILFNLPPEDKTITILDLIGDSDKVIRFSQVPIEQ